VIVDVRRRRVVVPFLLDRGPVAVNQRRVVVLVLVVARPVLEFAQWSAGMMVRNVVMVVRVNLGRVAVLLLRGLLAHSPLFDLRSLLHSIHLRWRLFSLYSSAQAAEPARSARPHSFHRRINRLPSHDMTGDQPAKLPYTGDDEADRLLAGDPLALLIGFVLDQQVPLQKAFSGPLELRRRIGTLDAARIAAMDPAELDDAFRRRPALHRFPGNMARRTQALCSAIVRDYGGDAGRVWREAASGRDLEARLLGLPGIGEMKARTLIAIIGRRFGIRPPGWEDVAPRHPTLGDVDSAQALADYQAGKRAHKAELRARAATDGG